MRNAWTIVRWNDDVHVVIGKWQQHINSSSAVKCQQPFDSLVYFICVCHYIVWNIQIFMSFAIHLRAHFTSTWLTRVLLLRPLEKKPVLHTHRHIILLDWNGSAQRHRMLILLSKSLGFGLLRFFLLGEHQWIVTTQETPNLLYICTS